MTTTDELTTTAAIVGKPLLNAVAANKEEIHAEPCMIVSAFHFKNGKRIMVITGSAGCKSFECEGEDFIMHPKPFAECPLSWLGMPPKDYHLKLRHEVHAPEDFVPKHSTTL